LGKYFGCSCGAHVRWCNIDHQIVDYSSVSLGSSDSLRQIGISKSELSQEQKKTQKNGMLGFQTSIKGASNAVSWQLEEFY
jgi:hypothetical protein